MMVLFAMRLPKFLQRKVRYLFWAAVLVGTVAISDLCSFLWAEGLWFQEVDYGQVFRTRIHAQGILGLLGFSVSLGFFWFNVSIAAHRVHLPPKDGDRPPGYLFPMGFRQLCLASVGLSLLIGIILFYHGRIALDYWRPHLTLTSTVSPIPVTFHIKSVMKMAQQLEGSRWWLLGLALQCLPCLIYPQFWLRAIALIMSLGFGLILSENWAKVLPAFSHTAFGEQDPLFDQDIGFYVFRLPLSELASFWLIGLFALTLVAVLLLYILSGDSLSQGHFMGFSRQQQRHLFGLVGAWMLAIALNYWLGRYELLYSAQGVTYGGSYTDVTVQLPVYTLLSLLALGLGALFLWVATWDSDLHLPTVRRLSLDPHPPSSFTRPLLLALGGYWGLAIAGGVILPWVVQRLVVQPNELALERPYLSYTINLTRDAFALDRIDVEPFDPQGTLTYEDLNNNHLTLDNIRLWDTRPLLEANRQLQQFRPYYSFPDADVDRYTIQRSDGKADRQQVLTAARELDYSAVPSAAQTWVNEHLVYTHGYGFTISPVNKVAPGGLPDYLIKDISHIASTPEVQASIPVGSPRIYYGELTNTYVMVKTQQQELDYPSGSDNIYNTYTGTGGVNIGSGWKRLLFAKHLGDWRMLLTQNFLPKTQLLFRRNINQRVRAIAPFLRYDRNPYLVVASPDGFIHTQSNYLYWIIDAYTTSDRYPYSDPLTNDFNYIRNSIKVVVDAYNGSVNFYIADPSDPIIQTWSRIFPGMFQPLSAMPPNLREHIRYPQDLFQVQSFQLMTYHMTDPQVFYNREDQWRAPTEIYGDEMQQVEPYYLIMKLPAESSEEFILLRLFTPAQRNNLIAWLAARSDGVNATSDENNHYGKMLLYRFPKQELVYGPEQIEARINQDPIISEQISLWNRQGSRAIQGNLLVIPIEQSLLYVEPLYLEAEQNRLPTLARVIVVYENRIIMAETLQRALEGIFEPEPTQSQIIRTLEDPIDTTGESEAE